MKQLTLISLLLLIVSAVYAQDNVVETTGYIGVGTLNPIAKLSIQSSGTINNGNYENSSIYVTDGTQQMGIDPNQIYTGQELSIGASTFMKFMTSDVEHMRIVEDGNIGIGTTSPIGELHIHRGENEVNSATSDLVLSQFNAYNKISGLYTGTFKGGISFSTSNGTSKVMEERMRILANGSVGIGTTTTGNHKLAVDGSIGAREIKVETGTWSDFVFEDDYELKTLEETEQFITKNNHLPEVPSASEVLENGINLGAMDAKLLQKVEELTLYLIEQNKELKSQKELIQQLQDEVLDLRNE